MPRTLTRDISPPVLNRRAREEIRSYDILDENAPDNDKARYHHKSIEPTLAAIEAGQAQIEEHLEYFARHFEQVARLVDPSIPHLDIANFQELYRRNDNVHGRHFVIHQHDHPISGVHYDLRLQFSETSTLSWSVPYGMPGNPNSVRPNRMAVETRVHTLWNNLIESASHTTGSLLIWDIGEYEILPRRRVISHTQITDDEESNSNQESDRIDVSSGTGLANDHNQRLIASFKSRYIKLRLRGARLPENYTISLRLPSANDRGSQPQKPKRKRRRLDPSKAAVFAARNEIIDSESGEENDQTVSIRHCIGEIADEENLAEQEDDEIRRNNAYPGAHNNVGSVHQRQWFLTLDRSTSGFSKAMTGPDRGRWKGPWEPFYVYGRDVERSVVTGRSADEVMIDEGVDKFVGRKMWRPIIE